MSSTTMNAPSQALSRESVAFGLSAAVTVLFNTVLALVKDSIEALNSFMASLTGHHWTTHAIFDLIVFVGLGFIFMKTGTGSGMTASRLAVTLVAAVVVAGGGLGLWFLVA